MDNYIFRKQFLLFALGLIILFSSSASSQIIRLGFTDSEKILGESGHIIDSALTIKDDVTEYKVSYRADSLDKETGKTGGLYYLFQEYKDTLNAKEVYSFFKKANKDHEGIKILHDAGDEAYFHSDEENFYYISIRKGSKLIIMKVNKITSRTSLNEFNTIARNFASGIK